jgi:hypothetical protein
MAFLQQAARLIVALPLPAPLEAQGGELAGRLAAAHQHGAKLLLRFCTFMDSEADGNQPGSANSSQPGAFSSSPAGGEANRQLAAWVVMGLVPHLAAAIHSLAAVSPGVQAELAVICHTFAALLSLAEMRRGSISSKQQLELWLAATDAGLRLQPLLRQLGACWRQQDAPAAQATAQQMVRMLWNGSVEARVWVEASSCEATGHEQADLAAQLAQMHGRGCRLLHWLAAGDNHSALPDGASMGDWMVLQWSLSALFLALESLEPARADSAQQPCAR